MIRMRKSADVPPSLLDEKKRYDEEDVKKQLLKDQDGKCYLCERVTVTDFVIEHLFGKTKYPSKIKEWKNLHLACSYCNGKKYENFESILCPTSVNIEDEIEQRLDLRAKRAQFSSKFGDEGHEKTRQLLNLIFNGKREQRNVKEERFFNYFMSEMIDFIDLVDTYEENHSKEIERSIEAELDIHSEFLGFKYWIVKSSPTLNERFACRMVWNKEPMFGARSSSTSTSSCYSFSP